MEFQHSRQKNAQLSRFHVTICLMSQCLSKSSNPSLLVISCPFFSLFHFFTLCRKVERLSSSNSCTCLSSYEVHSLCRGQRVAQIVRNVLDTDVAMLCQPASKQHFSQLFTSLQSSHLWSLLRIRSSTKRGVRNKRNNSVSSASVFSIKSRISSLDEHACLSCLSCQFKCHFWGISKIYGSKTSHIFWRTSLQTLKS